MLRSSNVPLLQMRGVSVNVSRTEIAQVLRKGGFPASKRAGGGHTSGYESWNFGEKVFVTYHRGTGNAGADDKEWITERNAAMTTALSAAGFSIDFRGDHLRVARDEILESDSQLENEGETNAVTD